jgi:hypothetical protein
MPIAFGCIRVAAVWLALAFGLSPELSAQDDRKDATPPASASAPAHPSLEVITLDELTGGTITGVVHYDTTVRKDGKSQSGEGDWTFYIRFEPKGVLRSTVTWQAAFPGKRPPQQKYFNTDTIGVPSTKRDQDGARSVVWLYEDNTLTQLRVYDAGGRRVLFKFARSSQGIQCTVESIFMKEDARKPPTIAGWEVLSRRQTRSTCRVSRS